MEKFLSDSKEREDTQKSMTNIVDDRWVDDVEKVVEQTATEIHIIKSIINYIENERSGNVVHIIKDIVKYLEGGQNENVDEARAMEETSDRTQVNRTK